MRVRLSLLASLIISFLSLGLFLGWTTPTAQAAQCDITEVIFTPHTAQIDPDTWFKRGNPPEFSVKIKGNGSCGGQTLESVSLIVDEAYEPNVLDERSITFNRGSNEINLRFKAGEEDCTAFPGLNDCRVTLEITSPVGTYESTDISSTTGRLDYECDNRFRTCDNDIEFELLNMTGGSFSNSECAFAVYVVPTPRQIGSPSESVTLRATIRQDREFCAAHTLHLRFLHGDDQAIPGSEKIVNHADDAQWEENYSFTVRPADLGYQSGGQVCFSVKLVGDDVNEESARAPVGIGVAPDAARCGLPGDGSGGGGGGNGGGGNGGGSGSGGGQAEPTTVSVRLINPIGTDSIVGLLNILGQWILNLAIPIAVIMILYAGFLFLTSQGKPEIIKQGRDTLWYAVIGLAVIFIGKGFFTLVKSILELGRP